MRHLAHIFTELTEGLAAGGSLLLLTDYDGTLTPLVADPEEAWLPREVRDDLRLLAQSPLVCLGILSGRSLGDLRARVGIRGPIYAGCHGLELEGPGFSFRHPEAEGQRESIRVLACSLNGRLSRFKGARVEPKGLSVAVHYRNVAPDSVEWLLLELEQALCEQRGVFKALPGKKAVEILPRVQWSKGECALWILDRLTPALRWPLRALYVGDDRTDELAFEALAGKAITARVGPGRALSAAAYRLRDVAAVHRLLSALAAEVGDRRHQP